ncbi:lysis system i-spanin subunit Rz [Pseudomonas sp. PS01297]|uniref:lysis system i-spanin subunit Rz n=1 Tax=Pseudomonas sp. PS01297 TaxID=2991433 RepID=UPI00249A639C|nr:lysis system i-spanin subunit Rz [Pseudomonas sp. PS01297]
MNWLTAALSCLVIWFVADGLIDERDSARIERDTAQKEVADLREAARISGEMLADRDEIDRTRTQELNHARSEIADLQRAVDAGTQRLFIKAACPVTVPAKTGTGGVADGAAAELSADARSDYFTLRDQLAVSREMILGLQDHMRRICLR